MACALIKFLSIVCLLSINVILTQSVLAFERVSVDSSGFQSNLNSKNSSSVSVSGDGRYVVFHSEYAFVPEDTNGVADVYLRDRLNSTTHLVSYNFSNNAAGSPFPSINGVISANGRYVAFQSQAEDIVAGISNPSGFTHIYVRDLQTNTSELVDMNSANSGPSNQFSLNPSISANGRIIGFQSLSDDLIAGNIDVNNDDDIYIRDLDTQANALVSINRFNTAASSGIEGEISGDGRFITFSSSASDLAVGDANGVIDIYLRDLLNNSTEIISRNQFNTGSGNSASQESSISFDGRYVVFQSQATNLVSSGPNGGGGNTNIFVRDRNTNSNFLVDIDYTNTSSGNNVSQNPSISADGRFVAFQSLATNLVNFLVQDTNQASDIFIRDLQLNTTKMITTFLGPPPFFSRMYGNDSSIDPSISADGGRVVFSSLATNLIDGDTNNVVDVYSSEVFAPSGPIVSATLPDSRSVQLGSVASAFASIINTSFATDAINCGLSPITEIPAEFFYQPLDSSNLPTGIMNQGADIPSGNGVQSYVFGFTPTNAFIPTEIEFTYDCANTDPAANTIGLNTLLMSSSATPVADIIGLTTETDLIAPVGMTSLYAVGSTNIGVTENITASLTTGIIALPINLLICQTDSGTGACLPTSSPATSVGLTFVSNSNATFAVFVEPTAQINNDPANNRIFIRFTDSDGVIRGATSTAVRTQ